MKESRPALTGGETKRRPFVLDKTRGGGGRGIFPLMLIAFEKRSAGLLYWHGRIFVDQGNPEKEDRRGSSEAQPRSSGGSTYAPGDLVPSDKVKPAPDEAKKGPRCCRYRGTKNQDHSVRPTQKRRRTTAKPLNQVPPFKEPDTTPKGETEWAPPPYGTQGEQQKNKNEKKKRH